jgi:Ca2+-binding EF-hand superfamily protein
MTDTDKIETLTSFFDFVDTDHDGFITVNEIRDACSVDVNADGIISEEEIVACAKPWLDSLNLQDLDGDTRISLAELLAYNGV